MKIPFLKEILLIAIGFNLFGFALFLTFGETNAALMTAASAALCALGLTGQKEDEDDV
jgi:hypothetical protein